MKARIIRIGDGHGIRLPKWILKQAGLSGEVDISVQNGSIVIGKLRLPREGWEEAAAKMHLHGDDRLLDEPSFSRFDTDEWDW